MTFQFSLRHASAICQEKERYLASVCWLLRPESSNPQGQISHSINNWPPGRSQEGPVLYQDWSKEHLSFGPYCKGRWMENCIQNMLRFLQIVSHAIRSLEHTFGLSKVYERGFLRFAKYLCDSLPRWYPGIFWWPRESQRPCQGGTEETLR